MKKIIALALVLVLALSLVACGGKDSGVKTYKVGVAIYQYNDNFMTLYRQEIEAYFKTLETDTVKYEITMVDGKNDMAEQTNQIDTFITQKMDVIICNLVQTSSAEVIIDKVVAADIPLILINREPLGDNGDESYEGIINNPGVCYVGADARQSGTYQGEIVLALDDKGDVNGNGKVETAEKGAFKVANSWGTNRHNDGFLWVSYDALNSVSAAGGVSSSSRTPALRYITRIDVADNNSSELNLVYTLNSARRKCSF